MSKHRIEHLYEQFGHLTGVTLEVHKELIAVNVANRLGSATIFLQGAQISHFQPADGHPILFLSEDCQFKQGSPLRGGIPICWPWFGNLSQNPDSMLAVLQNNGIGQETIGSAPAHGLVRDREWSLESIDTQTDITKVTLSLMLSGDEHPCWPFATKLVLDIVVNDALEVAFHVVNHHHQSVVYTGALHTYFSVNDIHQVDVHGLDGRRYTDTVGEWSEKEQVDAVQVSEEVDRIYQEVDDLIILNDKSDERSVSLRHFGCKSLVVWNPWVEKSARLSQFKNDDYQRMMCLESANTLENTVTLAPEQRHTMRMIIR